MGPRDIQASALLVHACSRTVHIHFN